MRKYLSSITASITDSVTASITASITDSVPASITGAVAMLSSTRLCTLLLSRGTLTHLYFDQVPSTRGRGSHIDIL